VGKRLIGRKFWGNFGSLSDIGRVMIFAVSKVLESDQTEGSD
jgi:hypothetical protein